MKPSGNQKQEVGLRIKEARSALGLTQKELCEKAGMKLPSLRDYELGNRIPGGEAVADLARVGINANWLLMGEGPMLLSELLSDALQDFADAENLQKTADKMNKEQPETYRMVPTATDFIAQEVNPAHLRMAILFTEDAAAVQPLTTMQRADMILSFYQRLTKGDEKQT